VSRELIIRPEAEAEMVAAGDWYDRERPGLGIEFALAVSNTITAIERNPLQYQVVWGQFRRAGVTRFPYSLIYRVSEQSVTVISCFHGRRSPAVWKKRI